VRKRNLIHTFFALWLLGLLGFSAISDMTPAISCQSWGFISSPAQKLYTHPDKIVIQPWRGQHHVYGIFMIPNGYQNEYFFTVTTQENKTQCGVLEYVDQEFEGVSAKPGYYLLRGYLNTRTAISLIFEGKGSQLNQPLNWKIGYIQK
jgi:hypothetical protein